MPHQMNIYERIGDDYIERIGKDDVVPEFCFTRGVTEEFIIFIARGLQAHGAEWKLMDSDGLTTYYTGERLIT